MDELPASKKVCQHTNQSSLETEKSAPLTVVAEQEKVLDDWDIAHQQKMRHLRRWRELGVR